MAKDGFTDKVRITIKAGNGGDGMNSFKAFKGKAQGGPDGGDGGKGGDIYLLGDKDMHDLLDYRYKSKYHAGNGERGGTNLCSGKGGADIVLKVPLGTLVRDYETGKVICDICEDGAKKLIARGGRGGKGNVHFTTARRHAPHFAQTGELTKPHVLQMELKVIADVGIIGFPNVGKSTLLSKISAAKPKVANYHFTTLSPNLGVVRCYEESFIAADIPGLIEGAAQGAGLGHDFLRHIERTRMLLHVVDISGSEGRDPIADFQQINAELSEYSEKLGELPQIIACNKCDVFGAEENLELFRKEYGERYEIYPIQAISGEGTWELVKRLIAVLATLPPVEPVLPEEDFTYTLPNDLSYNVYYSEEDEAYIVDGGLVAMLERNVVLNDADSMAYFQKVLRDQGVIQKLRQAGCKQGDTVIVGDVEFDFID